MKSNAECSRLRLAALVIGASWLTGCATVSSESVVVVCPPVVEYDAAEQARVASEVEALPDAAVLIDWMADYSVLREQARSCVFRSHVRSVIHSAANRETIIPTLEPE